MTPILPEGFTVATLIAAKGAQLKFWAIQTNEASGKKVLNVSGTVEVLRTNLARYYDLDLTVNPRVDTATAPTVDESIRDRQWADLVALGVEWKEKIKACGTFKLLSSISESRSAAEAILATSQTDGVDQVITETQRATRASVGEQGASSTFSVATANHSAPADGTEATCITNGIGNRSAPSVVSSHHAAPSPHCMVRLSHSVAATSSHITAPSSHHSSNAPGSHPSTTSQHEAAILEDLSTAIAGLERCEGLLEIIEQIDSGAVKAIRDRYGPSEYGRHGTADPSWPKYSNLVPTLITQPAPDPANETRNEADPTHSAGMAFEHEATDLAFVVASAEGEFLSLARENAVTSQAVASYLGLRFRAPITPAYAPHTFTLQTDVNTLGTFVRTDALVLPRLQDPRELFDEPPNLPDLSVLSFLESPSESSSDNVPSQSPFIPKPRSSEYEKIDSTIQNLRSLHISPFQLTLQVLKPDDWHYDHYRSHLYREDSSRLSDLVDAIMRDKDGKTKLLRSLLQKRWRNVERCRNYQVLVLSHPSSSMLGISMSMTPFLTRIFETAAQTERAKAHNKVKHPEKSSNRCLGFQAEFGLFLWATGCARQTIDAIFRCGLSVSYDFVLNCIESLSFHCDAKTLARSNDMHGFSYDNMNLSTSIFVEQRGSGGPAEVTSGTFGVLYGLRNAQPEHMLIALIMQRFRKSQGLQFNIHLRPALPKLHSFHNQLIVGIEVISEEPLLEHIDRRPFPVGWKTPQFPTRATPIEEATTRSKNMISHAPRIVSESVWLPRGTSVSANTAFRHTYWSSQRKKLPGKWARE
ncbi:hypothetical protein B0H13DRAFT_1855017 [Mycena leptocephala]|nr:hypothetical protein B0H13DRAFT_1855017 [Mycena leptocephala]